MIFNKLINLFFKHKQKTLPTERGESEINRIKELKQLKKIANHYLEFYIIQQKNKTKGWENNLIKRNISLLKEIINKINSNLHPNKVTEYLKAYKYQPEITANKSQQNQEELFKIYSKNLSIVLKQGSNFSFLVQIIKCSPRISYFNDLTWFNHGTIGEHVEYGLGKEDEKVFEKYLPYQIDRVEKAKDTFFSKDSYKDDRILVESIISLIKDEKYIPSNILAITLIEGIVRKFCFIVYKRQHPEMSLDKIDSLIYVGRSSFETLILETDWKKDISIGFSEFLTTYSHSDNPIIYELEEKVKLNSKAQEKFFANFNKFQEQISKYIESGQTITEEIKKAGESFLFEQEKELKKMLKEDDKIVKIGLDIYLDFLVSKFKDDRNNIIHGKYSFFKEKWRTLVYLTALEVLINKINWYENNVINSNEDVSLNS